MKLVIDISDDAYETLKIFGKGNVGYYHEVILDGKPLPTLTDPEQRLFLSAMTREEDVCKHIDEDKVPDNDVKMLVPLCQDIERKVKGVLF